MNTNSRPCRDAEYNIGSRPCGTFIVQLVAIVALFAFDSPASRAQIIVNSASTTVTVEGYGNLTTGASLRSDSTQGAAPDAVIFDGAARVLARLTPPKGPNIGLRAVTEASNNYLRVSEASLLLFGAGGRLEIGKRMGLPDVLTGYAPNSFTFTTAEFGPPTGRTLDPGGGLQTQFLRASLRSRIEPLAARGVTASLFNDESAKILYVLPKHKGWLGGVSFAPDAEDVRFDRLMQIGLVHETYWHQNVWRWGGSYAHARAKPVNGSAGFRDLDSMSLGTSVSLNDALDIGIAASHDGHGGSPLLVPNQNTTSAWGATASINYNRGPWTVGGYYQLSRGSTDAGAAIGERLSAFEVGASYRFTTRLRLYGAWFLYDLASDRRSEGPLISRGSAVTLGLRATL